MTARPGETLEELRAAMAAHASADGLDRLDAVYSVAAEVHAGQRRLSGDPYITHCLAVASELAVRDEPKALVFAGLLHDLPDVTTDLSVVEDVAGADVRTLVEGLQELSKMDSLTLLQRQGALYKLDRDVVVLKAADRLHNMRTAEFVERAWSLGRAKQNIELLVPLLTLLGSADAWRELDVLSRPYLSRADVDVRTLAEPSSSRESALVGRAAALLPTAERDRWATEWEADLAHLPPGRERLVFGLGLLWSALTIRADHLRRSTGTAPRRP